MDKILQNKETMSAGPVVAPEGPLETKKGYPKSIAILALLFAVLVGGFYLFSDQIFKANYVVDSLSSNFPANNRQLATKHSLVDSTNEEAIAVSNGAPDLQEHKRVFLRRLVKIDLNSSYEVAFSFRLDESKFLGDTVARIGVLTYTDENTINPSKPAYRFAAFNGRLNKLSNEISNGTLTVKGVLSGVGDGQNQFGEGTSYIQPALVLSGTQLIQSLQLTDVSIQKIEN